jgi:hypothetical protein
MRQTAEWMNEWSTWLLYYSLSCDLSRSYFHNRKKYLFFARDMVAILFSTFNIREGKHITILKCTHVIKKRACTKTWIVSRNCAAIPAHRFNDHGYRRLFERVPRDVRNIFGYSVVMSAAGNAVGHPRTGHEGPEGEQRYSFTLSLTSALDGSGWSTALSDPFNPGKTRYPFTGGWVGPRASLDRCKKSRPHGIICTGINFQRNIMSHRNWKGNTKQQKKPPKKVL